MAHEVTITKAAASAYQTLKNGDARNTAKLIWFAKQHLTLDDDGNGRYAAALVAALFEAHGAVDGLPTSPASISKLRAVVEAFTGEGRAETVEDLQELLKRRSLHALTWSRLWAALQFGKRNGRTGYEDLLVVVFSDVPTGKLRGDKAAEGKTDGGSEDDEGGENDGVKDEGLSRIMKAIHAARKRGVSDDELVAIIEQA